MVAAFPQPFDKDFAPIMSLVVVVPFYNEEQNVPAFMDRLAAAAADIGLAGLVVVDDGSTDATVTLVARRAAAFPVPVRLVRLSRNFGHQPAVLAGCEAACALAEERGADFVGVIDGDLQDPPEDFRALLDAAADQDVTYAVRSERHDGALMRHGAPLFYRLLSLGAHFPIPRNAGTFSVIRLPVCRIIVENADADPYFPGLRAFVGFRQKGVPLERQARAAGTSRVAFSGLVRLSVRAFFLYSNLPLQLLFASGAALTLFAGLAGACVTVLRLLKLIDPTGVTTIILLQLFSLGVMAFFIGIVAFMVARVRANTSRQRSWVVLEATTLPGSTSKDRT